MPWSAWIHTGFHVSGATQEAARSVSALNYGTVTLFGRSFQSVRLAYAFHIAVLQPRQDKSRRFGLFRFRSPLLTESILFLFLRILRCFTSPRFARPALLNSDRRDPACAGPGCPIRKSPDQSVRAAPRSFSQLAASFVA